MPLENEPNDREQREAVRSGQTLEGRQDIGTYAACTERLNALAACHQALTASYCTSTDPETLETLDTIRSAMADIARSETPLSVEDYEELTDAEIADIERELEAEADESIDQCDVEQDGES